jgi:hypothetical protein
MMEKAYEILMVLSPKSIANSFPKIKRLLRQA